MTLQVERTHSGRQGRGSWTYSIVGTKDEVVAEVQRIERRWPPQGYCTMAKALEEVEPGVWRTTVSHDESCE